MLAHTFNLLNFILVRGESVNFFIKLLVFSPLLILICDLNRTESCQAWTSISTNRLLVVLLVSFRHLVNQIQLWKDRRWMDVAGTHATRLNLCLLYRVRYHLDRAIHNLVYLCWIISNCVLQSSLVSVKLCRVRLRLNRVIVRSTS